MSIKVIFGVNEADVEHAGNLSQLKEKIAPLFNLPSNVEVKINDSYARLDARISDGDEVEFVKPAGSKG